MTEYGLWTRERMPDSPQQRHHRVLLPRYGTHFSIMHSHVVLHLRRCINSIFGTGIISQCCDGGVDPAVHPELRDLRGYAENTLLASLYGHHLICILSAMLHVGRSQPGKQALPPDSKTKQTPHLWGLFRFGIKQGFARPGRKRPTCSIVLG